MVKQWGDIQEDIYRERREPKELTGGRLREIFNFITVLWQRRNGRGLKLKQPQEREFIKNEIKKFQHTRFYIPLKLRKLYATSFEKLTATERPNRKLRRWVRIFTHCKKWRNIYEKLSPHIRQISPNF